jgi:hypothetical protein
MAAEAYLKAKRKMFIEKKCLVQQKIDRKIRQHLPYKWLPRSAYFSPKQKSINISGVIGTHFQKPINNSHKKAQNVPFQHRFVDNMLTDSSSKIDHHSKHHHSKKFISS